MVMWGVGEDEMKGRHGLLTTYIYIYFCENPCYSKSWIRRLKISGYFCLEFNPQVFHLGSILASVCDQDFTHLRCHLIHNDNI